MKGRAPASGPGSPHTVTETKEAADTTIDGSSSDLVNAQVIELTRRLVGHQTVSPPGNEAKAVHDIGDFVVEAGVCVEYQEVSPGRPNLIARLPGNSRNGHLVLSGHVDVVPAGSVGWDHDPFGAEIVDGRMYGRGTADMKGGVAAMAVAVAKLARAGFAGEADLILAISIGEEMGLLGARHMAATNVLTGSAHLIIGEPTGLGVHIAEKGAFSFRVTARGRGAHSSLPHLGINAVSYTAHLAVALESHSFPFARDELLGEPTVCITSVSGGTAPNMVPEECSLVVNLRTVRGQSREAVHEQVQHLVDRVTIKSGLPVTTTVELLGGGEATLDADPDHQLVRAVVDAAPAGSTCVQRVSGCSAGTDGKVLCPAYKLPAVIFGPGSFSQAHAPNEYVTLAEVTAAAHAYVAIAERMLGCASTD